MKQVLASSAAVLMMTVAFGASARADDFLQQEGDMWRASKLAGVNVYGPDNKKVGDITDVLMGKDGKAAFVVVGVGGFLGIGEKDVAIPFDKVKFTQEPMAKPTASAGAMAPGNTTAAGGTSGTMAPGAAPASTGMAPNTATGLGTPAATDGTAATPAAGTAPGTGTAMNGTAGDATMANGGMAQRPTAYPDHGTVDYTYDQLKQAPTFTFAK
jgi:sporulation protein YlmC with PRC-barrel domain